MKFLIGDEILLNISSPRVQGLWIKIVSLEYSPEYGAGLCCEDHSGNRRILSFEELYEPGFVLAVRTPEAQS